MQQNFERGVLMLQTGECMFSLTRETKELLEKLKQEGKEKEFSQRFWRTQQGRFVSHTLRKNGMAVVATTVEKRPGDLQENIYFKVRPL